MKPCLPTLAAAAVICLGGCASGLPPETFARLGPEMRPERYFEGTTRSFGVMEARSGAPTDIFHVEGHGEVQADGAFKLDQIVTFDGRAPQRRTWVMRASGPNTYTATLTDAGGPVTGEAYGNLFHIRYPLKSPPFGRMEQWLYLQPDGRTVMNEATVTVAGVVAARLSERITRDADASSLH